MTNNSPTKRNTRKIHVPVFIAGAGPAGLTTAALLAKYGIKALAISRYPSTANSPRAHITNQRAVEVFRDLGIENQIQDIAAPSKMMANCIWETSIAGKELARLDAWGNGDSRISDYLLASPSVMCNAPQHVMEPVLLDCAVKNGSEVYFNTELIKIEQTADAVHSFLINRETGEEIEVISDYAVGADGAQSTVVKNIGFEFEGEMGRGHAINCWFEADLSKYCEHRPGVLHMILQPGNDNWIGSGTFVCVKPWKEWVLLFMYNPENSESEISEEAIYKRIGKLIGDPNVAIKVKSISKWTINSMFAKNMVKGRIAIAGDAAHRHPPSGGLGSNTSVLDAFNLAWKLALLVKGNAGPKLLQTYSDERQPVAKQIVTRAITAMINMQALPQALGFSEGQSEEAGWASLEKLSSGTVAGKEMRKKLRAALELQNWQFNGIGGELGQIYQSSAILQDGIAIASLPEASDLSYVSTSTPGHSIPHAWLQRGKEKISTLDLVGNGKFTILTGPGGDSWINAAVVIGNKFGIEVNAIQIAHAAEVDDVYGSWAKVNEIDDDGCLLVRPDRFVAYRSKNLIDDPEKALSKAFSQILDRA